ncbi:hypothetical protein LIER_38854 [Lithospermum erythrorhizon]|uniref:VQ domain-containing protein n=1 Tax=Lithospermum erythrorhizon TaxID=34254 RepID=A0AAV3Q811_LITER
MEVTSKPQENEICSPMNRSSATPPLTPKTTISRSESNPYPTTFVQADTTSFKQVVQMLTGSSETSKQTYKQPPSSDLQNKGGFIIPPKKQGFKLYERRNSLKNGLRINPFVGSSSSGGSFSPRNNKRPEILSPSILDFPSLVLSPVTPLNNEEQYHNCSSEEEKAIAEKKFYLHPSPRTTTPTDDYSEPQLLSLFPLTSPKISGGASS